LVTQPKFHTLKPLRSKPVLGRPMQVYYFDLEFGGAVCRDEIGNEYESLEKAIAEMRRTLMYIARAERSIATDAWELVGTLRNANKQMWRGKVSRMRGADASASGEVLAFT